MRSGQEWSGLVGSALLGALALLVGCSDEEPAAQPSGPAGGIVEVVPDSIPLGENTAGTGQGGSGVGGSGVAIGGSGPAAANEIGKPCETSEDCADGLSCHSDPDYISHKQCTTFCGDEETCLAIEANSFCIGAMVCVHACTTDADCPTKTLCGDSGWCERTGPGSGVPHCGGFATPCGLLGEFECTGAWGCSDDSECNGVASSCYSQFSSFDCNSQDGCYWSSSSDNCSGSAHSCSSYSFSSGCDSQDGCYWSARCTGTPRECEKVPVTLCSSQPGCSTQTD